MAGGGKMKYAIYARISPRGSDFDKNSENSTEMQIEYCKNFIEALPEANEIVEVVRDEFYSGGNLNRPRLKKLLDDVQNDRAEWDCLCIYNLSRLTRSAKDLNTLIEIFSTHKKTFVSAREREFDFHQPMGEMIMGVMTYINQYMRKISAATTKDKMIQIARRGMWPVGRTPFGYKRGLQKDNRLYIDDKKSIIVRDIFEMYASDHYTTRDITIKYRGVLSKSQIMNVLRDKTYLGKICYDNQIYNGKHDAIISEDLFFRVQNKLPQKKEALRPKAYKYPFILSGILFCHCGKRLTAGTAKSGEYAYYTCTDPLCKTRISAKKIEQETIDFIINKMNKIPQEDIKIAIEELRKRDEERKKNMAPELQKYHSAQMQLLQEKKKVLNILLTQKINEILILELNKKIEQIETDLQTVDAKINALEASNYSESGLYKAAFDIVSQLNKFSTIVSQTSDKSSLRTIIPLYISAIKMEKDRTFHFKMNPALSSTNGTEWWA